jgi:hypothetical protein
VWTFAWLAISVYCFGLLVVYFVLLFAARKAIFKKRPTELSKAIDFLHRECTRAAQSAQSALSRLLSPAMLSCAVGR